MKLDLLNKNWLDLVFEGRNKNYGAYELRKNSASNTFKGFIIGAIIFAFAVATPIIADIIGSSSNDDDASLDKKVIAIKLPPKEKKPELLTPPPPPPPKVDQIKFVKPVVAKTEDITEEPPKVVDLKDKTIAKETIKGDPDAELTLAPVGDGPKDVVEETNEIFNSAGVEVKPEYPGGVDKFRAFIGKNFQAPEDEDFKGGKIFVSFVVERDGTLTDVKILRDAGFGTGKEALRVFKMSTTKWAPAEQNGKKVRCSYQLPINIQAPSE